jgi:hypothetical protein
VEDKEQIFRGIWPGIRSITGTVYERLRKENNMKIRVKLWGIHDVFRVSQKENEILLEFNGSTVEDLIQHLSSEIKPEKKNIIFNEEGKLYYQVAVCINWVFIPETHRASTNLKEGDFIGLIFDTG